MRTAPGLLLLASSLLLACGSTDAGAKSCTTIGCVDGLSVGLSQPFTTPGSYLVTVQTESGTTTCQTKLPFDGCQSGSPCSSPDVLLEQSGCALPADQHSIVGLRILKGFPSQVTITVARDGAEVLSSGAKAIGYQTSQPNGPDCEPVCKQASLTLTVDKPLPRGTTPRLSHPPHPPHLPHLPHLPHVTDRTRMTAPLCLIGMSGVGKSHWSQRLEALGFRRHDCDGAIAGRLAEIVTPAPGEQPVHALGRWMGMPWSPGYAEREARYLALEEDETQKAVAASLGEGRHVLDTTGSVIYLSEALLSAIAGRFRVVYLRTPESGRQKMLERYLEEPKPVVWGGAFAPQPGEAPEHALPRCFAGLLALRDRRYRALAHVVLDGGELEASPPSAEGFLARCGA